MLSFKVWLKDKKKSENVAKFVQIIATHVAKQNISQVNMLEIKSAEELKLIEQKLGKDICFILKDIESKKKYSKAIDLYYRYLCFAQEQIENQVNSLVIVEAEDETIGVDCNNQLIDNESSFFIWLKDTKGLSENIAKRHVTKLSDFCRVSNTSKQQLLNITSVRDFNRVIGLITGSMVFHLMYKYSAVLNNFKEFIKDKESRTIKVEIPELLISDQVNIQCENQVSLIGSLSDDKTTNSSDMYNRGKLENKMVESKNTSDEKMEKLTCWIKDDVYLTVADYRAYKKQVSRTNLSLSDYLLKLGFHIGLYPRKIPRRPKERVRGNRKEEDDVVSSLEKAHSPISKYFEKTQDFLRPPEQRTVIEDGIYYFNKKSYNDAQSVYLKILDERFASGIKISSSIQVNKLKLFVGEVDPQFPMPSNDALAGEIAAVAVYCGDNLYMSPNRVINDNKLLENIIQFVLDAFKAAKNAVYYDGIYNRFEKELIYTNIYNADVLRGLLDYYLGEHFCIKKKYISLSIDVEVDSHVEIEETIKNSDAPIDKDAIVQILPHISEQEITEALKLNEKIIYWQKKMYWHIDRIETTEEERNLLRDIIWFETQTGFISIRKLLEVLKDKAKAFIENNCITNHNCLKDILKYYFNKEFGFKYTFVGKVGEEMSGVVATQKFIEDKDIFTLSELIEFVEENDLPKHYELFISEAFSSHLRVDEEKFITKNQINLDISLIKTIEDVVKRYLINGYSPILSIDSFTIFPAIGHKWNVFLLQSVIQGYCKNLKILTFSNSVLKPIGVIVDTSFGYDDYEKILIDAIATQNNKTPLKHANVAIEFLYNKGYLAQKRMKNIENLFTLAKSKNTQA